MCSSSRAPEGRLAVPGRDPFSSKGLVAGLIRSRSLVANDWLAERLHMGARNTVSRSIRHARTHGQADQKARRLATRLEKLVAEQESDRE